MALCGVVALAELARRALVLTGAYPLKATIVLSWGAMLGPAFLLCVFLGGGVRTAWSTATAYVILLGILMFRRFRAGGWKSLRVIEPHAPDLDLRADARQPA